MQSRVTRAKKQIQKAHLGSLICTSFAWEMSGVLSFVLSTGEARRTGYNAMRVQVTLNAGPRGPKAQLHPS